jgi:hypothetical protein
MTKIWELICAVELGDSVLLFVIDDADLPAGALLCRQVEAASHTSRLEADSAIHRRV